MGVGEPEVDNGMPSEPGNMGGEPDNGPGDMGDTGEDFNPADLGGGYDGPPECVPEIGDISEAELELCAAGEFPNLSLHSSWPFVCFPWLICYCDCDP